MQLKMKYKHDIVIAKKNNTLASMWLPTGYRPKSTV